MMTRRITPALSSLAFTGCLLVTAAVGAYSQLAPVSGNVKEPAATPVKTEPERVSAAAQIPEPPRSKPTVPPPRPVPAEAFLEPEELPEGRWKPWYVPLSADKYLTARFSMIHPDYSGFANSKHTLVTAAHGGQVVRVVKVGAGGVAQIPDLQEGRHSLMALGEEGFAAVGVYISQRRGEWPPLAAPVIDMKLAPMGDLPLIQQIIGPQMSAPVRAAGAIIPENELGLNWALRPSQFKLDPNGRVLGRLVTFEEDVCRALASMDVHLIRHGKILASAVTDERGEFAFEGMATGNYSFVAVGAGRIGVMGAELIAAPFGAARKDAAGTLEYVSFLADGDPPPNPATVVYLSPMFPADRNALFQFLQGLLARLGTGGGGGMGGFTNGTGGGGGGGAAGGDALLAALLAGLLSQLVDSGSSGDDVVSPAGP